MGINSCFCRREIDICRAIETSAALVRESVALSFPYRGLCGFGRGFLKLDLRAGNEVLKKSSLLLLVGVWGWFSEGYCGLLEKLFWDVLLDRYDVPKLEFWL